MPGQELAPVQQNTEEDEAGFLEFLKEQLKPSEHTCFFCAGTPEWIAKHGPTDCKVPMCSHCKVHVEQEIVGSRVRELLLRMLNVGVGYICKFCFDDIELENITFKKVS